MEAIEQHPILEAVLAPLATNDGVGEALGEDPALDFLEAELMKVGSLHQASIDWEQVEQESARLLREQSKDLKVLTHLLQALQRRPDGVRFGLSLRLMRGALESWWDKAHPWPGEKGKRGRGKLFAQIVQRSTAAAGQVTAPRNGESVKAYCQSQFEAIRRLADEFGLPDDPLDDLGRALRDLPEAPAPAPEKSEPEPAAASASPATNSTGQSASGSSLDGVRLEAGNERSVRQTLLKVADFLCEQSPGEPLGYRVRRHAIWYSVTALPATRDGERTELAAANADRIAEYREAVAQNPDTALWARIEQSLSVSPFWLDGHYLSAELAIKLGHGDCARAIAESLGRLLKRLPGLEALRFNDGTPFIQPETLAWLASQSESGAGEGSAEGWEGVYQQARERLENEGLSAGLSLLEEGLGQAREPRDRFYWRLLSADLLREAGLKALARQYYQDLRDQSEAVALNQWEPGLLSRLDRNLEIA